ncbi:sigma-70 family RNA polymerase sigma factor [Georgenia sp. Z1344]|uniref:sigma-70 family RNA polymerase sigma factor n=1 Tax=Georgenia sp. Z1344 TaxID=3416706 RepID=UPI003CF6DF09
MLEHLGLARALARRFRGRGPEPEDLEQVAYLGLVKAVRGFDAGRGSLAAYATATILGELKRHFRDGGWMVRPPRPVQELQIEIRGVVDEHLQRHASPPSDAELARSLGHDVHAVREARAAVGCFAPQSIDAAPGPGTRPIGEDLPAADDGAFERVEELASLAPLRGRLTGSDRVLLRMRFVEEHTQQEIADVLGVSQMQVSRRLGRVLATLRLAAGTPAAASRRGTAAPSPTGTTATTPRTRAA